MQISIGTIFVSEHNYNFINEIRIKGHFKNMSMAVNTIIGHYQANLEQKEALIKRIQELTRIAADQKSLIDSYRGQIVMEDKQ
jgi:Arc/MetJ-type ribon-helix-helix transcriptional regulator